LLVAIIVFYYPILEYFGLVQESVPIPADQQTEISDTAVETGLYPDPATTAVQPAETVPTGDAITTDNALAVIPDGVSPDTVVIITGKYEVSLSSFGGGPVSMILREYGLRDGTPIEMMPNAVAATPEARFAGGTLSASQLNYSCNLAAGRYESAGSSTEVVYTYTNAAGGQLIKRYIFYPEDYHYDLVLTVNGREHLGFERKYSLIWNTPLGVTEPQADQDYEAMEAVAMMAGSRETLDDYEDNILNQSLEGYTTWAGVRQKYFAAVMIPRSRSAAEVSGVFANGSMRDTTIAGEGVERRLITVGMDLEFAAMSSFSDSFTVFVGPLDYELLSSYNVDLEDMLGIGTMPFVGWIIKPFALGVIWLLPRLYDYIPNYGLVIILFALLVKLVTLPLSMKSFKAMQAMRDLQPQIDKLKKQFKNDAQALNKATMKLYRNSGVSPMSGCLPMLPQMPLFISMFAVFRSTILLRDAPFFWIFDDLSRGASGPTDPYIILVVIMVGAQFVSQKVTMPSTGQNKMLGYMMPLFMGFIFYRFAAGLVLYWICFSLFAMLDFVLFKRNKKNIEVKNTNVKKA
jgi:YidC/Oxa1 family membrane protein insertase